MTPLAIGGLGLLALFVLILAQVPIGFAMLIVGVAGFALQAGWAPAFPRHVARKSQIKILMERGAEGMDGPDSKPEP